MTGKWYVVAGGTDRRFGASDCDNPEEPYWTVSQDPTHEGWTTDSGYPGYGLTKDQAEFLAAAANEKIERDANGGR